MNYFGEGNEWCDVILRRIGAIEAEEELRTTILQEMETRPVMCPGNEALAAFLVQKREEYFVKSYSDGLDSVFIGAHKSVCESRLPLHNLREVSKVKGIGKWLLKILAEFYKGDEDEADEEPGGSQSVCGKGKKASRRYLPKKNSAPYAILITLYRAFQLGKEFMLKQELIDAAEASGLATMPIAPNKGVVPPRYGGGPQYSYSGWSSMKTLTEKGLVVKKSNPAKYMLTDEGKVTAEECLGRAGLGLGDHSQPTPPVDEVPQRNVRQSTGSKERSGASKRGQAQLDVNGGKGTTFDMNKLKSMGFKENDIHAAMVKAKTVGVLEGDMWGCVLGILLGGGASDGRAAESHITNTSLQPVVPLLDRGDSDTEEMPRDKTMAPNVSSQPVVHFLDQDGSTEWRPREKCTALNISSSQPADWNPREKAPALNRCSSQPTDQRPRAKATTTKISSSLPDVSFLDRGAGTLATNSCGYHSAPLVTVEATLPTSNAGASNSANPRSQGMEESTSGGNELAVPPLEIGESFGQVYDVILILDQREQFRRDAKGSASLQKFADRMGIQFHVQVETRQLPVGDALWIARHKQLKHEYVLDFIVERKRVDDLWHSIKDNRYKQQKLRLMRCGVRRLLYLVEGDPNLTDASESLKTAAFTTEILEGFDVQRTRDTNETVQKYGELTHAIVDRYSSEVGKPGEPLGGNCQQYVEFLEHCKDIEMERVTDVFGVQLMQVRNVTEDMALAILERYPTLYSLVQAYIKLEGNVQAQEHLLKDIPIRNKNKTISAIISKNIYKLVWAS